MLRYNVKYGLSIGLFLVGVLNWFNIFRNYAIGTSVFMISEDAVKRSGNPNVMMKNPNEMESQVYSKANNKVSDDIMCVSVSQKLELIWYFTFVGDAV